MSPETNNINLDLSLKTIQGEDFLDENNEVYIFAKAIGNILAKTPSDDPMRSYILAKDIFETKQLKKSDVQFVEKIVKSTKGTPIITGQILEILK